MGNRYDRLGLEPNTQAPGKVPLLFRRGLAVIGFHRPPDFGSWAASERGAAVRMVQTLGAEKPDTTAFQASPHTPGPHGLRPPSAGQAQHYSFAVPWSVRKHPRNQLEAPTCTLALPWYFLAA